MRLTIEDLEKEKKEETAEPSVKEETSGAIKDAVKEQREKYSDMPFKKKMKNFWFYHKIHFFIALAVLGVIIYLVLHFTVFRAKKLAFSVYAINCYYVKDVLMDAETPAEEFARKFAEYENIDLNTYRIDFNHDITIDLERADTLDLANDSNLIVTAESHELDVIMGSGELVETYTKNAFYAGDLADYMPADFYQFLKENDYLYYYTDKNDEVYAIGVYLKDAKRMDEINLYPEETGIDPVAGIVTSYSTRIDVAVDFLEYLFDYPACAEETE
ncbi:MAG: hypothetical protein IKI20_03685 [Lachnospiraceae bacterium]|nr:hypothetical protein [Lachnospiraceae bacterium]